MLDKSNDGTLIRIRDAEVFKTNFAGNEERRDGRIVNNEGARYFLIWLEDEDAHILEDEHYRVKWTKPLPDSDREPRAYIHIAVAYPANFPKLHPKIVLISGNTKTEVTEDAVELIDREKIIKVKVEIRGRLNRDTGLNKAYASTLYVYVEEDPFADEFDDIDE